MSQIVTINGIGLKVTIQVKDLLYQKIVWMAMQLARKRELKTDELRSGK